MHRGQKHKKHLLFILCFMLQGYTAFGQTNVYFFPGQGSDERLFEYIQLDTQRFNIHHIHYPIPSKKSTMKSFAVDLLDQIDTSAAAILIGVSLGGMIASELHELIQPQKTIIISSAKHRKELPFRYRFQKYIPLYRLFPKRVLLGGAKMLQPLVEPDRNIYKETFKSMLASKDPLYMKRTIRIIIQWEKVGFSPEIIHVHGTKDHTLPIKNVCEDYLILDGSHMMTLTRHAELSRLLNKLL